MKNWQLLLAAASALTALSACDNSNPALTGPPREPVAAIVHKAVTETEKGLEVSFDNRMDILFVIDNSESMRTHQTNLKNNINKFIEAFASIDSIDYHIAYTFVHDRTRFKDDNSVVPRVCGGKILWDDVGTLQPFVGTENRRYLTRDDRANIVTKTRGIRPAPTPRTSSKSTTTEKSMTLPMSARPAPKLKNLSRRCWPC
jgi:hypothetical protein